MPARGWLKNEFWLKDQSTAVRLRASEQRISELCELLTSSNDSEELLVVSGLQAPDLRSELGNADPVDLI